MSTGAGSSSLIALLDLRRNSVVGLDGQTIVLGTDDFVGIQNVPPAIFHLVTASGNHNNSNSGNGIGDSSGVGGLKVAFVVFGEDPVRLVRRYDPQTEEVAVNPVDGTTIQNLLHQVQTSSIAPSRVLHYDTVVNPSHQQQEWRDQTLYINRSEILHLRGLTNGDKVVPGAYDPHQDGDAAVLPSSSSSSSPAAAATPSFNYMRQIDGKSIQYPPIPVIDADLSLSTHRHDGTKRFLSQLPPSDRTELFMTAQQHGNVESLGQIVLDRVLELYYHSSWQTLLGDLQLCYCLFVHLQCFASLVHWKDLVAMLALSTTPATTAAPPSASRPSTRLVNKHSDLYRGLLRILPSQLSRMDAGFLEDADEAGDNFLLPSLQRLHRNLVPGDAAGGLDSDVAGTFQHVLAAKFPQTFAGPALTIEELADEVDDEGPPTRRAVGVENGAPTINGADTDTESDGPVVVSADEIEASLARSAEAAATTRMGGPNVVQIPLDVRRTYPVLVAAIMPNEDIVMTCARALDEKNDVSLVREAAAYLDQVEKYRT
jgi:hypothetical protein